MNRPSNPYTLLLGTLAILFHPAPRAEAQSLFDWDANPWDFVGEIAGTGAMSIDHDFVNVGGSGLTVNLEIAANIPGGDTYDYATDPEGELVFSATGDAPAREHLDGWLNLDSAHTGIYTMFSGAGYTENVIAMGYNEGHRDDYLTLEFTFSGPVLSVTFPVLDIDKVNWTGPLGAEVSGRRGGWIDKITVTGDLNGSQVLPTISHYDPAAASAPSSAPANPYDAQINPAEYTLIEGNVATGRWETTEKAATTLRPDTNGWATTGTYQAETSWVTVNFAQPITSFVVQHENVFTEIDSNPDSSLADDPRWSPEP